MIAICINDKEAGSSSAFTTSLVFPFDIIIMFYFDAICAITQNNATPIKSQKPSA